MAGSRARLAERMALDALSKAVQDAAAASVRSAIVMGTKRPLDFIPEPVPAWKSSLPVVALAAVGLLAWASSRWGEGEEPPASSVAHAEMTGAAPGLSGPSAHASSSPSAGTPAAADAKGSVAAKGAADAEGSTDAKGSAAAKEAADAEGSTDAKGSPDAEGSTDAKGSPDAEGSTDAKGSPDAEGAASEAAAGVEGAGAQAAEGDAGRARAEDAAAPRPAPPPKVLTEAEIKRAQRVAAKLRPAVGDGRVRAAGELFVLVDEGERAWERAAAHCEAASIDGVGDWKLASRSELRQLDRARVLPPAAYWSRNRSLKDPDAAYAYDARQRRTVLWLKQEPNGAVVCTQPRLPAT